MLLAFNAYVHLEKYSGSQLVLICIYQTSYPTIQNPQTSVLSNKTCWKNAPDSNKYPTVGSPSSSKDVHGGKKEHG